MMDVTPQLVMGVCMIATFFCVIVIFAMRYSLSPRNRKEGKVWLFDKWQDDVFDTLFRSKTPEQVAAGIGVDVPKYKQNCKLCRIEPKLKMVVIDKLAGFSILGFFLIAGLITQGYILIVFGFLVAFPLITLPVYFVGEKVRKRKFQIADELPRFLDLLHTALLIDLPTEQAIELTAESLSETILAEEFKLALADTKMGAMSWQKALEKLASDYEIDVLSDFVLDLVNAYNNGASIIDSVSRKSKDIKQTNLLTMKERASKLTSTILLPVLFFKILPLLAILCIPVIQQLNSYGFGL